MYRALKTLGPVHKKMSLHTAERHTPRLRRTWQKRAEAIDPRRRVFVDKAARPPRGAVTVDAPPWTSRRSDRAGRRSSNTCRRRLKLPCFWARQLRVFAQVTRRDATAGSSTAAVRYTEVKTALTLYKLLI